MLRGVAGVTITSPSPGATVGGVVTVRADAPGTQRINWYVDGIDPTHLRARDTVAPFTYDWYTTRFADGPHTVYAVSGNGKAKASVQVYVKNAAPVVKQPPTISGTPQVGATLQVVAGVYG